MEHLRKVGQRLKGFARRTLDKPASALHLIAMKHVKRLIAGLTFSLGACLNNPTIDEEVAEKCGVSIADYQRAEAILDKSRDGMSLQAGRCRLTRASKDVIEGVVTKH